MRTDNHHRQQPSLFDQPVAPAAAASTAAGKANSADNYHATEIRRPTQRDYVLAFLKTCGASGATREQIVEGTAIKLSSVCGRVSELIAAGEVIQAKEFYRETGDGGKALVCFAKGHAPCQSNPQPPPPTPTKEDPMTKVVPATELPDGVIGDPILDVDANPLRPGVYYTTAGGKTEWRRIIEDDNGDLHAYHRNGRDHDRVDQMFGYEWKRESD